MDYLMEKSQKECKEKIDKSGKKEEIAIERVLKYKYLYLSTYLRTFPKVVLLSQ